MLLGAGVHLVLHAWAAAPIVEAGRVAGAVFESKEGRLAICAAVTIDCTGDGDLFHRAGAGSESDIDERDIHHCTNTAWLFGGVDMPRWIAFSRCPMAVLDERRRMDPDAIDRVVRKYAGELGLD